VFRRVLETAAAVGGDVSEVRIPNADVIRPTFTTVQLAESYHVHTEVLGIYPSRARDYGPDVQERLVMASEVGVAEYISALERVKWIRRRFHQAFQDVDVILTPVYAGGPSRVTDPGFAEHLGERIPFRDVVMNYTVPQDLTGLPSASIRAGFDDDGIPVGVQATTTWGNEALALQTVQALQTALDEGPRTWPVLARSAQTDTSTDARRRTHAARRPEYGDLPPL
jgi:Asp-tRNA(Asn)/Glu-tRNA(Gln) amidotransferase A subunit family amidase